jgi:Na+-translocating ferredoxin:NAD+ oxidoreductase subunit B
VNEKLPNIHYICTKEEAKKLIDSVENFWLGNCRCRKARGSCQRSPAEVCVGFTPKFMNGPEAASFKEINRSEMERVLKIAQEKHLVPRPFRDNETRNEITGICFCCDDCCCYFSDPESEPADKGISIEKTDFVTCIDCGLCEDLCYFKARKMEDGKLTVKREACYGCGLCVDVCPVNCITMVQRFPA